MSYEDSEASTGAGPEGRRPETSMMPQPGVGEHRIRNDEDSQKDAVETARSAPVEPQAREPYGGGSPAQEPPVEPPVEPPEAKPSLPGAVLVKRPEGVSERLRVSYRSLWRSWSAAVLGVSLAVLPEWPILVFAPDVESFRASLGVERYQLLMTALVGAGFISVVSAMVVIAYKRLASRFYLLEQAVTEERGLIARRTSRVDLQHIRSVDVKQSILQRILGTGGIHFASAGTSSDDVVWHDVAQPMQVQRVVFARLRQLGE